MVMKSEVGSLSSWKVGHLVLPSASLVPEHDRASSYRCWHGTFKRYFTGQATPPALRVATSQKCVRTGDLENVGRTARRNVLRCWETSLLVTILSRMLFLVVGISNW